MISSVGMCAGVPMVSLHGWQGNLKDPVFLLICTDVYSL